ncbi:hypothetical protein [Nonomuraea longispora]|uniref:hypothetical protein n=1 Tax=Nonomuraea longispora TaxID=1848320 RepID=UPI001FEC1C82|nr:hypothetical protein [Nonomuraea longispora]
MAEAAAHRVVEGADAVGDVRVRGQCRQAVALDDDGAVAPVFDEVSEEFVAQFGEGFDAVGGLAET